MIPENLENTYTGTFRRNTSIEQALNLVCKPFNLKFSRKSKDEYHYYGEQLDTFRLKRTVIFLFFIYLVVPAFFTGNQDQLHR